MTHNIETLWRGKMQFDGLAGGHTITLDTSPRGGGEDKGPSPKQMILTALAGCTGMDVVALMRKKDTEPEYLNIKVAGELGKGTPIEYVAAHITYEIRGKAEDENLAIHAITQSQELYCGVSSMLRKIMPITWEINYNGAVVFNNRPKKENKP